VDKGKTLVIWLPKGETLYFENVEKLENTDSELKFDYIGVSTGKMRSAIFNQINIVGFALEKKDN
jgi:hypothetical protein